MLVAANAKVACACAAITSAVRLSRCTGRVVRMRSAVR